MGYGKRGLFVSSRGGGSRPKSRSPKGGGILLPRAGTRPATDRARAYSPVRGSSNQKVLPVPSWLSTPQRPP